MANKKKKDKSQMTAEEYYSSRGYGKKPSYKDSALISAEDQDAYLKQRKELEDIRKRGGIATNRKKQENAARLAESYEKIAAGRKKSKK